MSKLKKVLLAGASYVLVTALAIGGTVAYLTDTDSAVNVMTLGNVAIRQIEKQRIEQSDNNTGSDNLEDFVDNKPLLPAVYDKMSFAGVNQAWPTGGYNEMFDDSMKNVIDKIVFVENTGKTKAYVRTIFAFEQGSMTEDEFEATVGYNINDTHWEWKDVAYGVTIDDNTYAIKVATYLGNAGSAKDVHPNGVLAAGETTRPSLLQAMLYNTATNADVAALDGNSDGKYNIIVLSQAVQADGFANATTALDTAFGNPSTMDSETGISLAAEWMGGALAESQCDTWDGTADTSWYNETDTVFTLTTCEQLAGLSCLVDNGNTFENKTILIGINMDFYLQGESEPVSFEPIGSYKYNTAFSGTFDGQGYTISNIYQSGWALENGLYDGDDLGLGLFGLVNNATIKNLKIDGASQPSEFNLIGSVTGTAYGECVFENITVTNSYMGNHSYYSGGIVGWASGNHKYINCDLDASNVISSQWGDFNNANGGIIGGSGSSGTYYFEDCDVACVIDAYNDVTSAYEWYAYRNAGMLIGNTGHTSVDDNGTTHAAAPNVTCVNCTVTYGKWANYTYCQFNAMNYPWVRVQAGESCHAYGNARYDYAVDANGNNVVDENHVHNDGEGHNVLLVFDQLFGGSQGGVYGTATHDGVTITYNNK